MEEPITAAWHLELQTDCPGCGKFVDLLEVPDFWDGRTLEPIEHDTPASDALEVECPKCGHEFVVKCEW